MVLPKSMRIKGYRCFNYIHKRSNKFNTSLMLLKIAEANKELLNDFDSKNKSSNYRCAISISNKVSKKAVIRNKIRRALHNHLRTRLEKKSASKSKWLLLSLKPNSINFSILDLQKECDKLLAKAGIYYE